MRLLFELSKEHSTIPIDEICCCCEAESISFEILEKNENIFLIKTSADIAKIKQIAQRLSYSFYVDELLFSCKNYIKDLKESMQKYQIYEDGSLAIFYKNRSNKKNSKEIITVIAEFYTKGRVVDLHSADIKIRAFITDDSIYVGRELYQIDRSLFEKRKVQFRPFFSPISLHPKLARSLVNLSRVPFDGRLLDPFCGTGGILLEAGLLGIQVIGSDIDQKMIQGCQSTLDHYAIKNYTLICSDIGDINKHVDKPVDAVVTDLPYARSTTTKGEDIKTLYLRTFTGISSLLKKNGFAVIGVSDNKSVSIDPDCFNLINIYEYRVHRSMTRYFFVLKKV
ncbi:MAG: methyltransferase domain-containing protein [Thermoplasmatota archaeon]